MLVFSPVNRYFDSSGCIQFVTIYNNKQKNPRKLFSPLERLTLLFFFLRTILSYSAIFFQIRTSKHFSYLSHIKLKIKHPQIFKLYKWKKAQTEPLASSLSGANQFCLSSERKSEIIDRIFRWHCFLSCDILQGKMPGIDNFWYPRMHLPIAQHSYTNQMPVSAFIPAYWSAEAHGSCFVHSMFGHHHFTTGKLRFKAKIGSKILP